MDDIEFEFDPQKSKQNVKKHGVSFEDAIDFWTLLLTAKIETRSDKEPRWIRIGKWNEKFYSCVYTVRGSKIRIISFRRSRREEEIKYHEQAQKEEKT